MAWTHVTDLPEAPNFGDVAIAAHGTAIYVYDRYYDSGLGDIVQVFHRYFPATDTWEALTAPVPADDMNVPSLVALSSGKLIRMGFQEGVYEYDIATDAWTTKTPRPTSGASAVAAVTDGTVVYVAYNPTTSPPPNGMSNIYIYDPVADTWDASTIPVPTTTDGFGGGSLHFLPAHGAEPDRLVYVNGWWNQVAPAGETAYLDLSNIAGGWTTGASEPTPRVDQAWSWSSLPVALVVSGEDAIGNPLTSVEVYDPATDGWSTVTDFPDAIDGAAGTAFGSDVYVTGGGDTAVYSIPLADVVGGTLLDVGTGPRTRGATATENVIDSEAGIGARARGSTATASISVISDVPVGVGYEVNGRTRGFDAVAVVTTDPVPPPTHVGYLRTRSEVYPAPTIINGQAYANSSKDPWEPTTVNTGIWGAFDIIIAGVNVTYFRLDARGNPIQTIIERITDKDPGGDDQCDLRFPGVTCWDHPGVGDLSWMYEDAPMVVRKLNVSGVVVGTVFEGQIGPIQDDTPAAAPGATVSTTVLHCFGIWGRLDDFITLPRPSIDQYIRPIPVGHLTPIDSAQFIYGHVRRAQLYGWPGKMIRPVNCGILTSEQGAYGEPTASRTIQTTLAQMQTASLAYTVKNARPRKLVVATRTWGGGHVDFSFRAGQRGVTHSLTIDPTQSPNAFYGQGTAPFGPVDPLLGRPASISAWANWQYPFAISAIPAYPLSPGTDFVAGDGHTGFQAFSDELRSHGYNLDSQNTYLTSDVDEVERFQTNSGIQVDGIVGPQTWNQAFQTGVNTKVLASAYIKEIYTGSAYSPFKTNARGGITGPNPGFDPLRHPRREILEQYGSVKKSDAAKSAAQEYRLLRLPLYRGTVTATNIDPVEMAAFDTRSGMTLKLKNHKGVDRSLFIAQVERVPAMGGGDRSVTWTVSEIPEGLMSLAQRLARNLGIRDVVASNRPPRHSSKNVPTWPVFDSESGAGMFPPGQAQTGGLWNKYLIPMGGQVDISAVKIIASANTKMAAAVFANPYLSVDELIALPGLANPSAGTDDPWAKNQAKLLTMGICWATGNPTAMQGYWPNAPGGTLTGVLADTASWPFRANSVWGSLFVWTQASCLVHGDPTAGYRALFPSPDVGG